MQDDFGELIFEDACRGRLRRCGCPADCFVTLWRALTAPISQHIICALFNAVICGFMA